MIIRVETCGPIFETGYREFKSLREIVSRGIL